MVASSALHDRLAEIVDRHEARLLDPGMKKAVGVFSLQTAHGRTHEVLIGKDRFLLKAKLAHSGFPRGGGGFEGRTLQIAVEYKGPHQGAVSDCESGEACVVGIFHDFLHLVVGTSDGKDGGGACHYCGDGPAADKAPLAEIPPRVGHAPEGGNGPSLRSPVALCWGHLKRVTRWLDDSWAGDVIGALCLFGILYLSLLIGWVLS